MANTSILLEAKPNLLRNQMGFLIRSNLPVEKRPAGMSAHRTNVDFVRKKKSTSRGSRRATDLVQIRVLERMQVTLVQ